MESGIARIRRRFGDPGTTFSPRFFDSDYCQKEVNAFLAAQKEVSNVTSGKEHRSLVLPVKLLSGSPSNHPLAAVQAQAFFAEKDGVPYEYLTGSPEYREALRRTAYAISQGPAQPAPKIAASRRVPGVRLQTTFGKVEGFCRAPF